MARRNPCGPWSDPRPSSFTSARDGDDGQRQETANIQRDQAECMTIANQNRNADDRSEPAANRPRDLLGERNARISGPNVKQFGEEGRRASTWPGDVHGVVIAAATKRGSDHQQQLHHHRTASRSRPTTIASTCRSDAAFRVFQHYRSETDIKSAMLNVCFTPNNGDARGCRLRANGGSQHPIDAL